MPDAPLLSVSDLTGIVKSLIEDSFPDVRVEGEISNWRPASSGHVYFTLKDAGAQIQAVMFRGRASRLAFRPADGQLVRARGAVGVYAARGQYQIVVEAMEQAGAGDILAMLEERKRRLAAEGLFDSDSKPPLPEFPSRVAVITSPTGAALRDILSVIRRRNASLGIVILPAAVQGDEAPAALARQLRAANAFGLGDVIILARGGGSIEDLLAFSDEGVVRAVAASAIPVISAVGHEIDFSLSDYAATLRAPTPSAAAELVTESAESVAGRVAAARDALSLSLRARLERARLLVESFSAETLELRLERSLQPSRQRFDDAKEALVRGITEACASAGRRLASSSALLEAASPAAVLARGYAVVRRPGSAEAIRNAATLRPGESVSVSFAEGGALAEVVELSSSSEAPTWQSHGTKPAPRSGRPGGGTS